MKRLFDEINYAQQRQDYSAARGFLPYLYNIVDLAKQLYPKNELIKSINDPAPGYFRGSQNASANMTTIKLQLLDIMDSLEIDFEEIRKVNTFVPTVYNISQSQNSLQLNSQSIDNIISIANNASLSTQMKEDIANLIDEYKKETESSKPNERKIKSILSKVYNVSKEVGVPLITHALQSGYLTKLFNPS